MAGGLPPAQGTSLCVLWGHSKLSSTPFPPPWALQDSFQPVQPYLLVQDGEMYGMVKGRITPHTPKPNFHALHPFFSPPSLPPPSP